MFHSFLLTFTRGYGLSSNGRVNSGIVSANFHTAAGYDPVYDRMGQAPRVIGRTPQILIAGVEAFFIIIDVGYILTTWILLETDM